MSWRAVAWLDRDGTIVDDPGYLDDPAQLRLFAGVGAALARLHAASVFVALVTNQSGIARGYLSRQTLDHIHAELRRRLAAEGGHLDAIYICPHLPEAHCDCRKPRPGMVRQALAEHPELGALPAFVIGDKAADLGLAREIAATAILVRSGEGRATEASLGPALEQVVCVDDIAAAVDWLLQALDGAGARC